jgi:ribosomal-protein-alanine N-acetyltransferase
MSQTSDKSYTRWLIKRDIPAVMEIENSSFPYPWTEQEFLRMLKKKNCEGFVYDNKETVVGFILAEFDQSSCEIVNFAVSVDHRRQGFGKKMINDIIRKHSHKRTIFVVTSDSNLGTHLFLSQMGFYATKVLKNYYDVDHDGYEFVYEGDF